MVARGYCRLAATLTLCVAAWGCGGGDAGTAGATATSSSEAQPAATSRPAGSAEANVTVALNAANAPAVGEPELEPGSAEWQLREITQLRRQPYPKVDDLDVLRESRKKRNLAIIEMATKAVALTHDEPAKQPLFDAAVFNLVDARQQLALQGDQESIDALYEHADSLFKRDPKSKAAVISAFAVVQYANLNARRFATQEPQWLREFSRRARLFAMNFPEDPRGAGMLFAAAKSCELHDLLEEAEKGYATLRDLFPQSPQAAQAEGATRRLALAGKQIQLAGPTIDGGYFKIDDYEGKSVLVVFWATSARSFLDQLPELQALLATRKNLRVVGINFDPEEPPVDAFLEEHELAWTQVFHSDPQQRSWNSPIATYYGIHTVPMYWLIKGDGTLHSMHRDVKSLAADLQAR